MCIILCLGKRKKTAEGEYDPSSPTSENNDETPAKKKAISADTSEKSDAKPASPKKKILPELEKYWKAVNDDPADFTGWTYLLQYVDQEVSFFNFTVPKSILTFCSSSTRNIWSSSNFETNRIFCLLKTSIRYYLQINEKKNNI